MTPDADAPIKQVMANCELCDATYQVDRRLPPQARRFCSRDCYYESQKVPLDELYRREGGICHLCHKPVRRASASRDHVVPRSHGGPTTWDNIRLAHRGCNSERGDRLLPAASAA